MIPENLKTPCPELLTLESGKAKDVLNVMIDDRRKYIECKTKHQVIVKALE